MRTASRSVSSVVQPSLPHAKPPAPRRKLTLSSWLPLLGSLALLGCQTHTLQPLKAGSILPLRSVRLYETGVGYFERSGNMGTGDTALPVPSGHLDDALKTLVVLSGDKSNKLFGLEFNSRVSRGMGRALAGLPTAGDEPLGYRDLLLSLRGAAVEVRAGASVLSGRLIDVLPVPKAGPAPKGENKADGDSDSDSKSKSGSTAVGLGDEQILLLLSSAGELHRIPTSQLSAVRPLDPAFATRLQTALDATSQSGGQSQRLLRLLSSEGGPVTLGYVSETPLWRVTYRLVLAESGKSGVLQGWALLHNDTDEDWRSVKVHLVNGRPDSFLFPLAAPRYVRRQLITPENELSTVPQLLGTNADTLWGDHVEIGESYGAGGLGLTGYGSGGGGSGSGTIGLGRFGTIGHGSGTGTTSSSSLLSIGNLAQTATATGLESGALFAYSLGEPLDLRAHGSALVPLLQEPVEVESITWLAGVHETARTGVRLANNTRQTLPAGPLAVFEPSGLAGEASIDRMKPGERRFIQYGLDLDVELTVQREQVRDEPQRLTFEHDQFEEHFLRRREATYKLENRSGQARTLYLTMALQPNAQVQGADRLDFDTTAKKPISIFELAAQTRVERSLVTIEGLATKRGLTGITAARLLELSSLTAIPQSERTIVTEAAARQKELEEAGKELDKTRAEMTQAKKDMERVQEHLKALGSDSSTAGAAGNPLVKRILDGEDKLQGLQKKLDGLESEQGKRRDLVRKALEKLPRSTEKK